MQEMVGELVAWLEAKGLDPANYRVRIEAKTIGAQRDLMQRFATEVEPLMAPRSASHQRPTLQGVELSIEGPLPTFR